MSKQVLKAGSIVLNGQSLGLLDVAVIDSPTKLDVSDTANNNEILIGRENWGFTATAIKNDSQIITPTTSAAGEEIVITFGSECWYGTGFVTSIELSGTLDDKVIFKIQGEFIATSYHIASNMNMVLEGGGASGVPDGWGFVPAGGGVSSIKSDDKKGRHWFIDTITVGTVKTHENITIPTGVQHGIAIVYEGINLATAQVGFEAGAGTNYSITPPDTEPNVNVWTQLHTGAAGEDRFYVVETNSGGGAAFKLFSINFGRVLKSIT